MSGAGWDSNPSWTAFQADRWRDFSVMEGGWPSATA
jgi:hypothetical protein